MKRVTDRVVPENLPYITAALKLFDQWGKALPQITWKKIEHFTSPETWCACEHDVPQKIKSFQVAAHPELHTPACHALGAAIEQLRVREVLFAPHRVIAMSQMAFLHFLLSIQTPRAGELEALQLFQSAGEALDEALQVSSEFCVQTELLAPLREFKKMYRGLEKSIRKRRVH